MRDGIFLAVFLMASILFLGQNAQAADYEIEQYHVQINVSEDNVYHITEQLQVNFNASRHGIYRTIPLKNTVKRADGSTSVVKASVSNVSCGADPFTTSRQIGSYQIKIGDANRTVFGQKTYTISYQYIMGKDVLKDADEFYFNVIGTEWDTTISNVTFSIRMPKEFDQSKLGMSYGSSGSVNTKGLTYSVQGNEITGKLSEEIVLYPGQGLTVRLELPEGYFVHKLSIPWNTVGGIGLGILTMFAAFLLWSNYGKDDPVVETVEFHAPEGLNSVEAAYFYRGQLQDSDVVSLVVYLAQKGYIEIRESVTNSKWSKDFVLVKQREYDGNKESERLFMQGLFMGRKTVSKKDLQNSFYRTINSIKSHVEKEYKKKIFYADSLNKNWILYLLLAGVFLAVGFEPVNSFYSSKLYALLFVFGAALGLSIAFQSLFGQGKLWARVIAFLMTLGITGCFCGAGLFPVVLAAERMEQLGFLFAVITTGVVSFFIVYMPRRTPYGNQMLGKIAGFKNFLETAEKPRLEAMVQENPEYFYDILPYAYALEVSDVWMKKFESIAMKEPNWYHSYGHTFNMVYFSSFMDSTMTAAAASMTSQPSSSGGGGVSGGGSGGGGGGSW